MLEVNDLACARDEDMVFANLSFKLHAGEALQVVGSNGAGKTSLLMILARLLTAASGTFNCQDVILYLGHKSNLHPQLSPSANLMFLCCLSSVAHTAQTCDEGLDFVGLQKFKNTKCANLSAGQRQRIQLARLYLSNAKLWLLDEPCVNLDLAGRQLLQQLCLQHLNNGGSILIASHTDQHLEQITQHKIFLSKYV